MSLLYFQYKLWNLAYFEVLCDSWMILISVQYDVYISSCLILSFGRKILICWVGCVPKLEFNWDTILQFHWMKTFYYYMNKNPKWPSLLLLIYIFTYFRQKRTFLTYDLGLIGCPWLLGATLKAWGLKMSSYKIQIITKSSVFDNKNRQSLMTFFIHKLNSRISERQLWVT